MTVRIPLVQISGRIQELPTGDTLGDILQATGNLTVADGYNHIQLSRQYMTGSSRLTLLGSSRLGVL